MKLHHILMFSLAAMCLAILDESLAVVVFGVMAWLGVALAGRLRPSLRTLIAERRLPTGEEIAAFLIGQGGALATFVLITLLLTRLGRLVDGQSPSLMDWLGWAIATAAAAGVCAPLWREIGQNGGRRLGAATAGLIAALPLGIGLFLGWQAGIKPLLRATTWSGATHFDAVLFLPAFLFLTASGAAAIGEALRREPLAARVLRRVADVGLIVWASVALLLVLDIAGRGFSPRLSAGEGGLAGATYAVAVALGWLSALWSIRRIETGPVATAGIVAFLSFAMLFSIVIPALVNGGTWADLVAVVMFPFLVITVGIIAFAVAPLCRLVLWRSQRRADVV
jgi:hypothetical protein